MLAAQLALLLVSSIAVLAYPAENNATTSTYDTKFDNIDLDELLGNDRLLRNYIKCLEFEGPCTPDGKMLRDTLPDAVLTNCEKCSDKQRIGSEKVTHYLIDHKPEDWARLEKLFDPEGGYRISYLEAKAKSAQSDGKE